MPEYAKNSLQSTVEKANRFFASFMPAKALLEISPLFVNFNHKPNGSE
jgi:hypothetical protein